jgi:diguanylate cyclase (GGDEF)-like protein/PAS domain S-box-containing protein
VDPLYILIAAGEIEERRRLRRDLEAEASGPLEVAEATDRAALEAALGEGAPDVVVAGSGLGAHAELVRLVREPRPECVVLVPAGEEASGRLTYRSLEEGAGDPPGLSGPLGLHLRRARELRDLRESEGRYRRLFLDAPLGLYRVTPGGEFLDVNPGLVHMLGYHHPEPLLAVRMGDLYMDPGDRTLWEKLLQKDGHLRGFKARFKRRDGGFIWVEDYVRAARDARGAVRFYEGCLENVTLRHAPKDAVASLEKAVENLPIGVTISDLDGRIVYTNPAEARSHGYTVEELIGREARILVTHADKQPLKSVPVKDLKPWKRERMSLRKDGTTFPAQLFSDVIISPAGAPVGVVTTSEDISDRKRIEEDLRKSAFYDALTGLPNRSLFVDRLGRALERARRRRDYVFAVLFLDLDRFKLVNDSFGHPMGDRLLVETARKLESVIRPSDTVSRLGGDEFAILAEDIRDTADAVAIAERAQRTLAEPIELLGQELFSTASIGIALGGPNYEDPGDLLRDADTAMYNAKAQGKARFEIFDEHMQVKAQEVKRLDSDLRRALERSEFFLVYQPVASVKTGAIVGAEALLRWRHPTRGELLPEEFVVLAEEIGLIQPIGDWALRNACQAARSWSLAGHDAFVAVNLSARQFRHADLVSRIGRALKEAGLDPSRLELELTESAVMENVEESIAMLTEIRDTGVRLGLDDFGTGYSSLSHLKHLPLETLKIDRTFVRQVPDDRRDAAIAASVIALAHSLGLKVVAEGVESREQLSFLRAQGCDLVQGTLVGRPAVDVDFERDLGAAAE